MIRSADCIQTFPVSLWLDMLVSLLHAELILSNPESHCDDRENPLLKLKPFISPFEDGSVPGFGFEVWPVSALVLHIWIDCVAQVFAHTTVMCVFLIPHWFLQICPYHTIVCQPSSVCCCWINVCNLWNFPFSCSSLRTSEVHMRPVTRCHGSGPAFVWSCLFTWKHVWSAAHIHYTLCKYTRWKTHWRDISLGTSELEIVTV